jgi:hypothetical protein
MPALSPVKKERVRLGGSRMGTKKQDGKGGKTVFMGVLRKKLKHTVIQKYFFLEILINLKAGRVKEGARKVYHGRCVGQAWFRAYWPLVY